MYSLHTSAMTEQHALGQFADSASQGLTGEDRALSSAQAVVTSLSIEFARCSQQQSLSLNIYRRCLLSSIESAIQELTLDCDHTRWITVVVDPITASWLASQKLESQRLRVIRVNCNDDALWSTWEALSIGNSASVIAALNNLSNQEKGHFELAARKGNTKGFLINQVIPQQHTQPMSQQVELPLCERHQEQLSNVVAA